MALKSQQTPQGSINIDFSSLLSSIIAIMMMVGFMKIMNNVFPDVMATTPSTKMRGPKPSEQIKEKARQVFHGPVENKDWNMV